MYYVTAALLRTIYFVISDLYLRQRCQIWEQNKHCAADTIEKNKKQSDKNPASTDFKSGERIKIMLLTPLKKYKTK